MVLKIALKVMENWITHDMNTSQYQMTNEEVCISMYSKYDSLDSLKKICVKFENVP
jgi:hypothetical protein